jgi:hypothetical protein
MNRALAKVAAMRRHLVVLLAVMFALSPLEGVAGEKPILDVNELAGSWHGWTTRDDGQDRTTLFVSADGRPPRLDDTCRDHRGDVLSERRQPGLSLVAHHGEASLSEDQGTTTLTVMPADPKYHPGRAEYERAKE